MKINRLTRYPLALIVLLVSTGAIGIWFFYNSVFSGKEIKNIILVSIDTCRADYLSCYGFPEKTTPNIDAVAEEGILFTNAYAQVPITLPSHSSMLTGTIPPIHGVHSNTGYKLSPSNITITEILRKNGFSTAAVVGAFVLNSKFGLSQGFDYYDDSGIVLTDQTIAERKGAEVSRSAVEWLDSHQKEKFFLFLHYFDPHAQYEPPEPFASKFRDSLCPDKATRTLRCFENSGYAGEIAYTDHCIGEVINKLKDLGLYDSTLIIITSDHGEMLGEHGEKTHGYFIYQSAIKVPLIFRLPGSKINRRIDAPVGLIDIVPTICTILGIDVPNNIQGEDLSNAFIKNEPVTKPRHLYCESLMPTILNANSFFGIINDRWKYIQTTRPELYDLVGDPGEAINQINDRSDTARILEDRLRKVLSESSRKGELENKTILSDSDRKQLESLGYISGIGIKENFKFNTNSKDPKDLIELFEQYSDLISLMSQKKYPDAKEKCNKILQEHPWLSPVYLHLSTIAIKEGDFEGAVDYLTKLIRNKPDKEKYTLEAFNYAEIYYVLGQLYGELGKNEEEVKSFSEALRIDPSMIEAPDAHCIIASQLFQKGNLESAAEHYRKAIKLQSTKLRAYFGLGNVLFEQEKPDETIRLYQTALTYYPDNMNLYKNIINVLAYKGDIADSIVYNKKALALNPNDYELHYYLGELYKKQESFIDAETKYIETLNIKSNYYPAMKSLARVYELQEKYGEAANTFKKIIDLNPENTSAHYRLACLYAKQNQIEESIRWLKTAVNKGYNKWDIVKTDRDLENIRSSADFQELIRAN